MSTYYKTILVHIKTVNSLENPNNWGCQISMGFMRKICALNNHEHQETQYCKWFWFSLYYISVHKKGLGKIKIFFLLSVKRCGRRRVNRVSWPVNPSNLRIQQTLSYLPVMDENITVIDSLTNIADITDFWPTHSRCEHIWQMWHILRTHKQNQSWRHI